MKDMDTITRLDRWFSDRLQGLQCSPETIAYIAGVLGRSNWDDSDMSTQSIVLAYANAKKIGDFASFQKLGDWILFVDAVHPSHLSGVRETAESLGKLSYYTCHRILRCQWHVYEELADALPVLAQQARLKLMSQSTIL